MLDNASSSLHRQIYNFAMWTHLPQIPVSIKEVSYSSLRLSQCSHRALGYHCCPAILVFLPLLIISRRDPQCSNIAPQEQGRGGRRKRKKTTLLHIPCQPLLLFICKILKRIACTRSLYNLLPFTPQFPSTWHLTPSASYVLLIDHA